MLAIFKKELKVYFNSILGYIIMFLFIGITGAIFLAGYIYTDNSVGNFTNLFSVMNGVFLFIVPLLAVRLLAEDKKRGTYELLLTSPLTSWEIIMGKFLAVFTFTMIGAVIMLIFPIGYAFIGKVQWEPLLSTFLGMALSFAFFLAIGMTASSLTENYIIAGLISVGITLILFFLSALGNQFTGIASEIINQISFSYHFEKLSTGIFEVKNILYYLIGAFLWLFLAKTVVESKTWK